jgi:hypothetical protein
MPALSYGLGTDRPDLVTYVLTLSSVSNIASLIPLERHLTYRRAADMLFFAGRSANAERKARCVTGLRALLGVAGVMNEQSALIARANLEALSVPMTDEEYRQLRSQANGIRELSKARAIILEMFDNDHRLRS